ncbi:ankyrin repeat domain-containing protein [Jiangella gansuensis]|uniref:ankyrin repeat domain-containing protein n=1 Tax=Jiangella gansuensis TaxID=281473 RepID=UPI0012F7C0C4|nr:ankyrin repeat domain-containing protein [Jiangella gansuensis]
MTWSSELTGQLDFYWVVHLRPRLAGLTDDEYLWKPVDGSWSLRPAGDGRWDLDSLPVEPPIAPVTTIAWRVVHVGRDVLGKRARAFFAPDSVPGGQTVPDDVVMYDERYWPEPPPRTAADALAFLDQAYGLWHDGVAALDDAAMRRPLGPKGGPYAEDSMAALVLHVSREVMAHGAEICLLRDLYRAYRDREDPLVAAALRGDGEAVERLAPRAAAVRPTLIAEAAGLRHWDVVRALARNGAEVNAGNPGALHYAAAAGTLDVIRLLVERGADTSAVDDRYHLPPAGWAEFFGHTEAAAYLHSVTG